MILSADEIVRRLQDNSLEQKLIIKPYASESQQPASYDLRSNNDVILTRGICTLVASLEWIELPYNLSATMRCRSSFARRGLLLGGGYIDPGFRGQLTMSLTNMGKEDIFLKKNDRVVQMVLHEITAGSRLYNGRYQDSIGVVQAREL